MNLPDLLGEGLELPARLWATLPYPPLHQYNWLTYLGALKTMGFQGPFQNQHATHDQPQGNLYASQHKVKRIDRQKLQHLFLRKARDSANCRLVSSRFIEGQDHQATPGFCTKIPLLLLAQRCKNCRVKHCTEGISHFTAKWQRVKLTVFHFVYPYTAGWREDCKSQRLRQPAFPGTHSTDQASCIGNQMCWLIPPAPHQGPTPWGTHRSLWPPALQPAPWEPLFPFFFPCPHFPFFWDFPFPWPFLPCFALPFPFAFAPPGGSFFFFSSPPLLSPPESITLATGSANFTRSPPKPFFSNLFLCFAPFGRRTRGDRPLLLLSDRSSFSFEGEVLLSETPCSAEELPKGSSSFLGSSGFWAGRLFTWSSCLRGGGPAVLGGGLRRADALFGPTTGSGGGLVLSTATPGLTGGARGLATSAPDSLGGVIRAGDFSPGPPDP